MVIKNDNLKNRKTRSAVHVPFEPLCLAHPPSSATEEMLEMENLMAHTLEEPWEVKR